MCERCYADEGRPVELPDNAEQILLALHTLYSLPGMEDGGPISRTTEHFDVEDEFLEPFPYGPQLYPAETIDAINAVLSLLRPLPRYHRAAIVAYWLDFFEDPTLCPYAGCGRSAKITHEIRMWPQNEQQNYNPRLSAAQRVLACSHDTARIVAHQRTPQVDRNVLVFTYDVDAKTSIADVTHEFLTQTG